jgi:hypothetical protein
MSPIRQADAGDHPTGPVHFNKCSVLAGEKEQSPCGIDRHGRGSEVCPQTVRHELGHRDLQGWQTIARRIKREPVHNDHASIWSGYLARNQKRLVQGIIVQALDLATRSNTGIRGAVRYVVSLIALPKFVEEAEAGDEEKPVTCNGNPLEVTALRLVTDIEVFADFTGLGIDLIDPRPFVIMGKESPVGRKGEPRNLVQPTRQIEPSRSATEVMAIEERLPDLSSGRAGDARQNAYSEHP